MATIGSPEVCEKCYLDDIACFFEDEEKAKKQICGARRYLRKIKHLLFRIPGVSAVDVGFLFCEAECRYVPQVGIRVHYEVEERRCHELTLGWNRIPLRSLKQMICLFGSACITVLSTCTGRQLCDEDLRFVLKNEVKIRDVDEKDVCFSITDTDDENSHFLLEFVGVHYQAQMHAVQAELPIPNSEGFCDEAVARLGRYPVDPLVGGISIGNQQGSSGTLGAVVWDSRDGKPCILSNWHVLSGVPGSRVGGPVYQPALFDGGHPEEDRVGRLKRWMFDVHGDAALAQIDEGINYAPGEILGLWLPIWEAITPKLGMEVRKWGRGTGFTKGFIDGIDMAVKVEYSNIGFREYDHQFRIAPICAGQEVSSSGDSGAIWVAKTELKWSKDLRTFCQGDTMLTRKLQQRRHATVGQLRKHQHKVMMDWQGERDKKLLRVYFGVGLQFAGDVPGSSLREHAVASSLVDVAHRLEFSLRPVFPHPDNIVPQPQPRSRRSLIERRNEGRPTFQISTDAEPGAVGPQPEPDRLTGHP